MREQSRHPLPARRRSETFVFEHGDFEYVATLGYYDDGRLGEIFIQGLKITTVIDAYARDTAVLASLALQYGCTPETIRGALIRDGAGKPATPIAALLDLLKDKP